MEFDVCVCVCDVCGDAALVQNKQVDQSESLIEPWISLRKYPAAHVLWLWVPCAVRLSRLPCASVSWCAALHKVSRPWEIHGVLGARADAGACT